VFIGHIQGTNGQEVDLNRRKDNNAEPIMMDDDS